MSKVNVINYESLYMQLALLERENTQLRKTYSQEIQRLKEEITLLKTKKPKSKKKGA